MWNYLGLAEMAVGENKNGRKAFEQAVKLEGSNPVYRTNLAYAHLLLRDGKKARSEAEKAIALKADSPDARVIRGTTLLWDNKLDEAEAEADMAIGIDSSFSQGYVLKSDALMRRVGINVAKGSTVKQEINLLADAVRILKSGGQKCKDQRCREMIKEELDQVEPFYAYFSRDKTIPSGAAVDVEPGVTPLKIIKKSPARYTESARAAGAQGTITLAVIFGANGRVETVLLLKRLERSLDQQAVAAARNIQFEPMKRNGVAVPVVKMIEYSFSIY